jgi:predicted XRE-type DNA-binding protein
MKDEQLHNWLKKWGLTSSQGAKVLRIQKSKMSEYLSETSDRVLPSYIQAHIETFDQLSEVKARKIIENRIKST